ncbi:MAG: serine/threonine protein kinase, partial [Myxococcaceae bacterium]
MAPPGASAADLDRGRRVGKYEILTRLSMGGMAELFLAYTSGPGGFRKFVAVKQILPDVKKDDQFVKMFLDEARITAAFSHGNIGQVFDLGEEDGELYLAMEFISGQNLEQVTKRAFKRQHPIPVGYACRVVRDACQGLHYAHAFTDPSGRPAPVIHRDVSPKNVMITYTGDVKMIDFGIAKAKNRLGRTQVGIVKGTSGYMSPEQVQNFELDGRSDLFSAGVMLHELITGHRLFSAPSDAAMMIAIVEGDIPTPRSVNPRIPEALSDVVMKALARKREHRFATGKEMARAIDQAAASLIFDEDRLAEEMRALFEDKMQTTRSLLELATNDDAGSLSEVAGALRDEAVDAAAKSATPRGRPSSTATPVPRDVPASATPGRGRAARSPVPDTTEPALPARKAPSNPGGRPVRSKPEGANRYASKVGADYA